MQASQFDNYWWVMHLDSQKTFEAETTTKNPQQKVSDINILCVSLNPSGFPFFFFRFQLDTKWTYVDSVDLFFNFPGSKVDRQMIFCVLAFFIPPVFFFETKTSADLRLKTEVSPCVAARTTSSHALTCIQSWGAGFLKKKMIFSVCVVKQGRTNIIMERKATKTQQAMILKRKHIRT